MKQDSGWELSIFFMPCSGTTLTPFPVGVRTGGGGKGGFVGEGVCSLPPPNFGQQEKIWAKPVFKDISMLFYYFEVGVIIQLHSHETVVAYHVMSFWLLGKGIIC